MPNTIRGTTASGLSERMSPQAYAIYDRTFMAFGSIMNGLQGFFAKVEDSALIDVVTRSAWSLARELTEGLVSELYGDGKISPLPPSATDGERQL